MTELMKIKAGVTKLFVSGFNSEDVTPTEYRSFAYPKAVGFMKFEVEKHRIEGFGSLMTMLTNTPFGMQLLTCSFMPFEGGSVPFLLIDIMLMGKKRLAFVEYYDCTAAKPKQPLLSKVYEKHRTLPDYNEKPAWYVGERTEYSLIKALDPKGDKHELSRLIGNSVRAYKHSALNAPKDPANLEGLLAFRQRMLTEGNPSSAVLNRVFGEKGAQVFFISCVMPDK